MGAELSTDLRPVVCNVRQEKSTGPNRTCSATRAYRIKWKALVNKNVRNTLTDSICSLFRELPERTADPEKKW